MRNIKIIETMKTNEKTKECEKETYSVKLVTTLQNMNTEKKNEYKARKKANYKTYRKFVYRR